MGINSVASARVGTGGADHGEGVGGRSNSPTRLGIVVARMGGGGVYGIEQSGGVDEGSNCCGGCLRWLQRLWQAVRSFFARHCPRHGHSGESVPESPECIPGTDVSRRPSIPSFPPPARQLPNRVVMRRQAPQPPSQLPAVGQSAEGVGESAGASSSSSPSPSSPVSSGLGSPPPKPPRLNRRVT